MFVVAAIGKSQAKVGIAGGKLTNGKLATIKLGKSLTLVNDATGARYVIQLLYTGTAPEATAAFSAPAEGAPTTSAPETTAPASTTPAGHREHHAPPEPQSIGDSNAVVRLFRHQRPGQRAQW